MILSLSSMSTSAEAVLDAVQLPDVRELFNVAEVRLAAAAKVSGELEYANDDFSVSYTRSELCVCPRCRMNASALPEQLCTRCKRAVVEMENCGAEDKIAQEKS
jgi:hypothetical protein